MSRKFRRFSNTVKWRWNRLLKFDQQNMAAADLSSGGALFVYTEMSVYSHTKAQMKMYLLIRCTTDLNSSQIASTTARNKSGAAAYKKEYRRSPCGDRTRDLDL